MSKNHIQYNPLNVVFPLLQLCFSKYIAVNIKAVSTQQFEDEVKNGYDVAMVAPQIRHRFDTLSAQAKEAQVPCAMITPQGYSPLGGPKLLKQIQELLSN